MSNAQYTAFAQILQGDFAKLGISLTIKPEDTAAYLEAVNNWRYEGFWLGGGSLAHPDPTSALTKSRAFIPTGNSSAVAAPTNGNAVALVDRATPETDPINRRQIFGAVE